MKKHSNLSTTKTKSFIGLFARGRPLRSAVGVLLAVLGLIGAAGAATDFCQKTSQDAFGGCQETAEGDYSFALGKCENFSDPTVRADCRTQAAAAFADAKQTCRD